MNQILHNRKTAAGRKEKTGAYTFLKSWSKRDTDEHFDAHKCPHGPSSRLLCHAGAASLHLPLPHRGTGQPHRPPSCCFCLCAQPALHSFPPSCCSLRPISVISPSGSAAAATIDVPSSARFGGDEIGRGCMAFLVDSLTFFSVLPPVSLDLTTFGYVSTPPPCRHLTAEAMPWLCHKTLVTSNTRFPE